jgi:hypothetical protein
MAQDSDVDAVFSALQFALHEHTTRLRNLATAELTTHRPIDARIVAIRTSQASVECAICGKRVSLEDSKVSEDGQPVHEECYVSKITASMILPLSQ